MRKLEAQLTKKTLMLKEKVDVIKYKNKSGCGNPNLAEKFFVWKTQILSIIKYRDKVLHEFETNKPSSNKEVLLVKQVMKKLINWSGNGLKIWVKENSPSQVPCCKKKHSNLPKT